MKSGRSIGVRALGFAALAGYVAVGCVVQAAPPERGKPVVIGCSTDRDCTSPQVCRSITEPTLIHGSCVMRLAPGLVARNCLQKDKERHFCELSLSGEIDNEQVEGLRWLFSQMPKRESRSIFVVKVDSAGGDVDAAMGLGRLIRSRQGSVEVARDSVCASACVFVLAAGVNRLALGPVIIHRPYRTETEAYGYDSAQAIFRQRSEAIRTYLDEMNIPTALYEAMVAIPSESGRRLSPEEIAYYRLEGSDPVWEEERNAAEAKRRGLTMTEYLRRKGLVGQCNSQAYEKYGYDAGPFLEKCEELWTR